MDGATESRDRRTSPDGTATAATAATLLATGQAMLPVVRELLSGIPAGCTWLLPVLDPQGAVVDFEIAAVSAHARDVAGRGGDERVGHRVGVLYPRMVGGPLWNLYQRVYADGAPGKLPDFTYHADTDGVAATSLFDVSVHRVCGGLLVWWQRLDEQERRREQTELLGNLGWGETDLTTGAITWSPGMYRIFERDPALGPMSTAEQTAHIVADDQPLRETAWQMLDSGAVSDLTFRIRVGDKIKHMRLLADTARDTAGKPVKLYGVVQDVTARENSRTDVEKLRAELRVRELTMVAEHRLAGQLQQIIQPLPEAPFTLADLDVWVNYLPAENSVRVGGDWYHALPLPDGRIILAIGDVVGHGLAAATAMANLRYALVGWSAVEVGDPGRLLSHLNQLCLRLETTATAAIAVYQPTDRTLRWARAGHPLPLHHRAGRTTPLARVDGLLLGATAAATYRETVCQLHPGDLLLFYTDGLIERRGQDTTDTLGDVAEVMAAAAKQPDGQPLAHLTTLLTHASPDDDTCLLAIHLRP
ncbi:PP2C family protein-serine/threonine phosphatase [Catellatospora tritici]|uniref:PP2C family protein-serine/threonine phosphatase n=1 Tax=Catellatospora tritici TaxID=2851566 RepID=UPI0027E1AC75|nr:SpoIIE family protein phosphatase [Catellatospora tritici]